MSARWAPYAVLERRVTQDRGWLWHCCVVFQVYGSMQFTDTNAQVEEVSSWCILALLKGLRSAKREKKRIESLAAPWRKQCGWN